MDDLGPAKRHVDAAPVNVVAAAVGTSRGVPGDHPVGIADIRRAAHSAPRKGVDQPPPPPVRAVRGRPPQQSTHAYRPCIAPDQTTVVKGTHWSVRVEYGCRRTKKTN